MPVQNYNTYAEAVNGGRETARRGQTLTKVNDLGLGVIYNWDFLMSYSPEQYNYGLKPPSELQGGNNGHSDGSGKDSIYKSRFMYVGLSVQLPTMKRMKSHVEDSSKLKDAFHTVLREAVFNNFNFGGEEKYPSKRTFGSPFLIPEIINICSFFDLGALESYYISTLNGGLTKLSGNEYKDNFPAIMESGSTMNVAGVNTAAGDQGGPLRQAAMVKRGIVEWVMAAYFALYEGQSDILQARKKYWKGFNSELQNLKSNKQLNMTQKISGVFQSAIDTDMTSEVIAAYFKMIIGKPNLITNALSLFGLVERTKDIKGDARTDLEVKNEELLYLLSYLSYDTKSFKIDSFTNKKGEFLTEARNEFLEKNLDTKLDTKKLNYASIKDNIKDLQRGLEKQLKIKMGSSFVDEVRKMRKPIIDSLTEIQKGRFEFQSMEMIQDYFEKHIREVLAGIEKNFDFVTLESLDVNIVKANKEEIAKIRSKVKKDLESAIETIYASLTRAVAKTAIAQPQGAAALAGSRPRSGSKKKT